MSRDELDDIVDNALEIAIEPQEFTWASDNDERRRAFVLDRMCGQFVTPQEFDQLTQWLKTGLVPQGLKVIK